MAGEELVTLTFMMFGVGTMMGIFGYYFYNNLLIPRRWPYKVLIHQKVGDHFIVDEDRAYRMVNKKTKEHAYMLRKRKERVPPYDFKILQMDKRGKQVLELTEPQKSQYFPVKFTNPDELTVEDKGTTTWLIDEIIRQKSKWGEEQSFLEKYMPFILFGLMAVVMIVLIVMFFQTMPTMTGQIAGAVNQMTGAVNTMNELCNRPVINNTPPI